MSQDNRTRILNHFAGMAAKDIERAMACYADNVELISFAPVEIMPHLGHRHTKAEVREMLQAIQGRYASLRYEPLSIVSEDNRIASIMRAFFKKKERDRVVQIDIASFFTFDDDGLVTQQRDFLDSYDLVQQVLEVDLSSKLNPPAKD